MFRGNRKPSAFLLILAILWLIPGFSGRAQDQGYNFIDLDIPLSTNQPSDFNLIDEVDDVGQEEEDLEVSEEAVDFQDQQDPLLIEEDAHGHEHEHDHAPQIPAEAYQNNLIDGLEEKETFATGQLSEAEAELEAEQARFDELQAKIQDTEEKLGPVREEINSLQQQLEIVNGQIRLTQEKITNVEVLIAETEISLRDAMLRLEQAEIELSIQEEVVLDYIVLLYEEEVRFFNLYDNSTDDVKLLLSDRSVSENLLDAEYFAIMEELGRQVFYDLDQKRLDLEVQKAQILQEQADLNFLNEQLDQEQQNLQANRVSKTLLLEITEGEEERYQELLAESLRQQEESKLAIEALQGNIEDIEEKIRNFESARSNVRINYEDLTPDELAMLGDEGSLMWPVDARRITATFHDPTYPSQWGMHTGTDIASPQGSLLYAVTTSYVLETADNGYGYSYITLVGEGGFSFVYGHVSEILVTPGTIVERGEVIGLSGGAPGTLGAGLQTTGAHLHFEMLKDGQYINALDYLP